MESYTRSMQVGGRSSRPAAGFAAVGWQMFTQNTLNLAETIHDDRVVLDIARRHGLSVYDAACLEVAARHRLPIASLNRRLRQAAAVNRIALIEPDVPSSSSSR